MNISENASYIKGLAEGMGLDETTKEGKVILKLVELVGELARKVEDLESENDQLYGYLEEMARDLIDLENDFYVDDEDEEYEDYSDLNDDEDFEGEDDEEYYEVECPSCGEKICFTEDLDLDELVCPACGEKLADVECDGNCDSCEGCDTE